MQTAISINTPALGDTLAAIPTIRKISKAYETPITVFTQFPELFQNHPCVKEAFSLNNSKEGYNVLNTFSHIAGKDHNLLGNKIQFKYSHIDIRQFHAISLGFSLLPKEMEMDLYVEENWDINFKDYVVIHPTYTWPSRTWGQDKWQDLIYKLNKLNIPVVAIGKNSIEQGNMATYDKKVMEIDIPYGINLMNHPDDNLLKVRNLFSKSKCVITMDSGMLHLAGTTDAHIIQLGSSINPKLRAPYRKGTQDYKYTYVKGECDLFCASNLKYNLKEWNSIQGVPPLADCLEKKPTFECHSSPQDVIDIVTSISPKPKLLIIAPHLSTGGSPQYVLDYLAHYQSDYSEVKLIEFSNFSSNYTIQKNKLIDLLGKNSIITLGNFGVDDTTFNSDKEKLLPLLEEYSPDIVWMNEFPEAYEYKKPPKKVMDVLYSKDRSYKIIETTHNNSFDFLTKEYIPDEFMFCSTKHIKESEHIKIPKKIWEVPISKNFRPDREQTLKELGLDPSKYHVLNVGLIHSNKNQKAIFDIAEQTLDHPIQYHFIGNHCFLNSSGITETQKSLPNCKLWGERSDVHKFMSCMDLYLFPSKKELNPLTVKEALSWNMEVVVNFDPNYTNQYKNLNNFHLLQDLDITHFIKSKASNIEYSPFPNKIIISYHKGVKVEVAGPTPSQYEVSFYDNKTNVCIYNTTIKNNMWTSPNRKYYTEWRTVIKENNQLIHEEVFNLKNKKVFIKFESKAIGDTIAWFPYVEEFRKHHDCQVICSSFHNDWFSSTYPDIEFVNPGTFVEEVYASYKIGWFFKNNIFDADSHKSAPLSIPLQQTAADILGLPFKEIKPKLTFDQTPPPIKEKYVTISIQSTCQAKYWNHPTGWEQLVKYIQSKGYKVAVVDKHRTFGTSGFMNTSPEADYHFHGKPLKEIISIINGSQLHIGIGSGLSWLSWALNTPTMLISSFSKPYSEFTDCTRIYVDSPTSGYYNTHKLDPSNWNWYPFKEIKSMEDWYEIETITPEQVINSIKQLL